MRKEMRKKGMYAQKIKHLSYTGTTDRPQGNWKEKKAQKNHLQTLAENGHIPTLGREEDNLKK